MSEKRHAISLDRIPYDDHNMLLKELFNGSFKESTKRTYAYSYRFAMGALDKHDQASLSMPLKERILYNADIISADFIEYLQPLDAEKCLREFQRVAGILVCEEIKVFSPALAGIRQSIDNTDRVRLSRERKSINIRNDLPLNYRIMVDNFLAAKTEIGKKLAPSSIKSGLDNFALALGALEKHGIEWKEINPLELFSEHNVGLLVAEWCTGDEPWTQSRRLNAFAFTLKHMLPGVDRSNILNAASNVRALNPYGNTVKGVKRSVSLAEVPKEDVARFAFACPEYADKHDIGFRYSRNQDVLYFNDRKIALKRVYGTREDTQEALYYCLRSMTTAMRISDPILADMPTEERDYDRVVEIYDSYYMDDPPVTRLNRLVNLKSLLRRILPEGVRLDRLSHHIKLTKQAIDRKDVIVPDLLPSTIHDDALVRLKSIDQRIRDLQKFKTKYVDPVQFAALYRDYLMIALLTIRPIRLRSLQSLKMKNVTIEVIDGKTIIYIHVEGDDVKTGDPINFIVPQSMAEYFKTYMETWRKTIAPQYDGEAVWVSLKNQALSRHSIKRRIPELMTSTHDVRVNVHLFRHIVETAGLGKWLNGSLLDHADEHSAEFYRDAEKRANLSKETCLSEICAGFF